MTADVYTEEEMFEYWLSENNNPESEEWREELTPEQLKIVKDWDKQHDIGMDKLWQSLNALLSD